MATINYKDPSTKQWIEIPTGITVDTSLSSTSENPVQNKVINSALGNYYTKTESDAKYSQATNIENGAGDVLIKTTDTNQSFKVMKDGRAKVQSAPVENDDVVRKVELDSVKTIANNAVVGNSTITSGTHTKITYDSKGLVTGGTELVASDIPDLPASKITSGTFSDDRIAGASAWNAKLDSSVLTQSQVDLLF